MVTGDPAADRNGTQCALLAALLPCCPAGRKSNIKRGKFVQLTKFCAIISPWIVDVVIRSDAPLDVLNRDCLISPLGTENTRMLSFSLRLNIPD